MIYTKERLTDIKNIRMKEIRGGQRAYFTHSSKLLFSHS